MDEEILCFKKELLPGHLNESKVFYDESVWQEILNNLQSIPRSSAERDYNFKQLVVYAVVRSENLILSYRRTPKTNEERLRQKYSIGIGGHINIGDSSQLTLFDSTRREGFLQEALWREINEEIKIKSAILDEPQTICFINDDSDDVGKVHFGTVWVVSIEKPEVFLKKERGIGELEFVELQHLQSNKDRFEKWSQLLIDYFSTQDEIREE